MDIKQLILDKISKQKEVRVADLVKATGFSRAYVSRFFQELKNEGKVALLGRANKARYVLAEKSRVLAEKKKILNIRRILRNKDISEDIVLDSIEADTGIFLGLKNNLAKILEYAFTEILNNAIEHSRSKIIEVSMERKRDGLNFNVIDRGVGIFNNIIEKRKLKNELEAIQDLIKGKQTTAPKQHTGEGIFFTSKAADTLTIQSSRKKLIFDNKLNDIFIKDAKYIKGTKVFFNIGTKSAKNLEIIFKEYSGDSFGFEKTKVIVKLYKMGAAYISRSQGRRVFSGLDKFKTVELDFRGVDSVGQAFADEVFRIWKSKHPRINIIYKNADENIDFMIKRALVAR